MIEMRGPGRSVRSVRGVVRAAVAGVARLWRRAGRQAASCGGRRHAGRQLLGVWSAEEVAAYGNVQRRTLLVMTLLLLMAGNEPPRARGKLLAAGLVRRTPGPQAGYLVTPAGVAMVREFVTRRN